MIATISWRKFIVLSRGLSPNSVTVTSLNSRHEFGSKGEKVNVVTTPEAAEHAFMAAFGHLKPKT